MKARLGLLILTALLVSCSLYAAQAAPVIINPEFEEGWHLATTFWTLDGGPYHTQFVEITPPEGWTAWWFEGPLCSGTPGWRQGRPEVRVISTIPDPTRIHSGDQAAQFFTFWVCHRGGLYQQVVAEPEKYYTVQVYGHAWFSNCDRKPNYRLPLDYDCDTDNPITWAHDLLRIGVDPLGGIDPAAPSVKWSGAQENYGSYSTPLVLRHVEALSSTITVFLESNASHPLKHCDVYWDDVLIWDSSYQVFLPAVIKEG